MQFTKNIKHITLLTIILLSVLPVFSQEDVDTVNVTESDSVKSDSTGGKRHNKILNIFKRKNKADDEFEDYESDFEEDDITDSIPPKKKFKLSGIFKRKNKNDSIVNDSITSGNTAFTDDSLQVKEKSGLFKRNKNDSTIRKPERIKPWKWMNMNTEEQDSLLRAWDDYDKEHYKKKYAFTRKDVEITLKGERNFLEQQLYNRARNKPYRYRKRLIKEQNKRYRTTLMFDRLDKSETAPGDSVSDARQYQVINKRYKREAKKEAIRKNRVVVKYDRKEDRLRRDYELSDNERIVLNKGKGMKIKGAELVVFNNARKKQETFTEELIQLRKDRVFHLQSENVQDRMKDNDKKIKERAKHWYSSLFKKKKEKRENKHDSHEYPKRYHK